MKKKRIIAIAGKKGSGKDTVGDMFPEFKRRAFADSIKSFISDAFDIAPWKLEDRTEKEKPMEKWWGKSPRDLMKDVGDSLRAGVSKDIWVNILFDRIRDLDNIIITDLRFKNEFKRCKEEGVFIIKVVRPEIDSSDTHISEVDLDDIPDSEFDAIIVNDGSLDELKQKVEQLWELIKN